MVRLDRKLINRQGSNVLVMKSWSVAMQERNSKMFASWPSTSMIRANPQRYSICRMETSSLNRAKSLRWYNFQDRSTVEDGITPRTIPQQNTWEIKGQHTDTTPWSYYLLTKIHQFGTGTGEKRVSRFFRSVLRRVIGWNSSILFPCSSSAKWSHPWLSFGECFSDWTSCWKLLPRDEQTCSILR